MTLAIGSPPMYSMVTAMRYGNLRVSAPKGLLTGPILSPLKHLIGQMLLRPVSPRLQWYIVVVMCALYAQWTIIILQWKIVFATRDYIPVILISVPMVALIAWVAKVGENPEVLAYISYVRNFLLQTMFYDRAFGTLSVNFASSGSRLSVYLSRGIFHFPNGLLALSSSLLAGWIFPGIRVSMESTGCWPLPR